MGEGESILDVSSNPIETFYVDFQLATFSFQIEVQLSVITCSLRLPIRRISCARRLQPPLGPSCACAPRRLEHVFVRPCFLSLSHEDRVERINLQCRVSYVHLCVLVPAKVRREKNVEDRKKLQSSTQEHHRTKDGCRGKKESIRFDANVPAVSF